MKKMLLLSIAVLFLFMANAQRNLTVTVKNSEDKSPLPHATVSIKSLNRFIAADSLGIAVFEDLAAGNYSVSASSIGFKEGKKNIQLSATMIP